MSAKTGPKPRCTCGNCSLCRRREAARRHYHGEPPLNPKRFRRPQLRLPEDDLSIGYIAGLLDGEGCITQQNGRWKIQIAMTHQPVIDWLGQMGGTVRERKVTENRQRCWRWLLMRQADVHAFLVATVPLLRVKRDLAIEVIVAIEAEGVPDVERMAL